MSLFRTGREDEDQHLALCARLISEPSLDASEDFVESLELEQASTSDKLDWMAISYCHACDLITTQLQNHAVGGSEEIQSLVRLRLKPK